MVKPLPAPEEEQAAWGAHVQAKAARFAYPVTPDIAGAVTQRLADGKRPGRTASLQRGWAIAVIILTLAASLLAVPQVRGAVIEMLRIGAVRIFRIAPQQPPAATVVPLSSVLDLAGATTLEAARDRTDFPLRLPHDLPELGAPDAVYVQDSPGHVVIMAWRDEIAPGSVALVLYQMTARAYFAKLEPRVIEETTVDGQPAIWAEGPYVSLSRNGELEYRRLVEGNALIWTSDGITYRLETSLELDDARRIAESLR